tara:strand:- start:165 stop:452 length:288 start_codon:yes stop_codon:yes gene_type:complete
VNRTNVITIEKDIPIPAPRGRSLAGKYNFVLALDRGDSFVINGNTPDITAKAIKCWVYNQRVKGITTNARNRRYATRTLSGTSLKPTSVRIWRTR